MEGANIAMGEDVAFVVEVGNYVPNMVQTMGINF